MPRLEESDRLRGEIEKLLAIWRESGVPPSREKLCLMFSPRYTRDVLRGEFKDLDVDAVLGPPTNRPIRTALSRVDAPPTQGLKPLGGAAALSGPMPLPTSMREQPGELLGEGLSYQYVPLIQCSLPHSETAERSFTRRNGRLELTIAASHQDYGLPYGVPARLLTIFASTEIVRTRSREIFLGKTLQDFLRRLDVPIIYGSRSTVAIYSNQLMRLIRTMFSIEEDLIDTSGRQGLHIKQTLFAEEARLWGDSDYQVGEGSVIVLAEPIYQSMLERSAPMSTAAIKMLRRSPMDLDVYAWLVHRLFGCMSPSLITWSQLAGQIGHSYTIERKFKSFFLQSLKRVHRAYPEANFTVQANGLLLKPSRAHIAHSKPKRVKS